MKKRDSTLDSYKGMRLSISVLEQDLAYFDARLALLNDEPGSHYQDAQMEIYSTLRSALGGMLLKLIGGKPAEEGIAVSEIAFADRSSAPSHSD